MAKKIDGFIHLWGDNRPLRKKETEPGLSPVPAVSAIPAPPQPLTLNHLSHVKRQKAVME